MCEACAGIHPHTHGLPSTEEVETHADSVGKHSPRARATLHRTALTSSNKRKQRASCILHAAPADIHWQSLHPWESCICQHCVCRRQRKHDENNAPQHMCTTTTNSRRCCQPPLLPAAANAANRHHSLVSNRGKLTDHVDGSAAAAAAPSHRPLLPLALLPLALLPAASHCCRHLSRRHAIAAIAARTQRAPWLLLAPAAASTGCCARA